MFQTVQHGDLYLHDSDRPVEMDCVFQTIFHDDFNLHKTDRPDETDFVFQSIFPGDLDLINWILYFIGFTVAILI